MASDSKISSVNMGDLLAWVKKYAAQHPSPKAAAKVDRSTIRDIVQCGVIQPYQVREDRTEGTAEGCSADDGYSIEQREVNAEMPLRSGCDRSCG